MTQVDQCRRPAGTDGADRAGIATLISPGDDGESGRQYYGSTGVQPNKKRVLVTCK